MPRFPNGCVTASSRCCGENRSLNTIESEILLHNMYYNYVSKLLGTYSGFSDRDLFCSVRICAES